MAIGVRNPLIEPIAFPSKTTSELKEGIFGRKGNVRNREKALFEVLRRREELTEARAAFLIKSSDNELMRFAYSSNTAPNATKTAGKFKSILGGRVRSKYLLAAAAIGGSLALINNTFSGSDDAYNTIEGFGHGGFSEPVRKALTDFGSGYQGLPSSLYGIDLDPRVLNFRLAVTDDPEEKKALEARIEAKQDELREQMGAFKADDFSANISNIKGINVKNQTLRQIRLEKFRIDVEDADTLVLHRIGNFADNPVHIRLAGIDAPEVAGHTADPLEEVRMNQAQPYGQEATTNLKEMIRGRGDLSLVIGSEKTYGRYVGALTDSSSVLNVDLLRSGSVAALPFGEESKDVVDREYAAEAQKEALDANRGMWQFARYRAANKIAETLGQPITFNTLTRMDKVSQNLKLAAYSGYIEGFSGVKRRLTQAEERISVQLGNALKRSHGPRKRKVNEVEGLHPGSNGLGAQAVKENSSFGSGHIFMKGLKHLFGQMGKGLKGLGSRLGFKGRTVGLEAETVSRSSSGLDSLTKTVNRWSETSDEAYNWHKIVGSADEVESGIRSDFNKRMNWEEAFTSEGKLSKSQMDIEEENFLQAVLGKKRSFNETKPSPTSLLSNEDRELIENLEGKAASLAPANKGWKDFAAKIDNNASPVLSGKTGFSVGDGEFHGEGQISDLGNLQVVKKANKKLKNIEGILKVQNAGKKFIMNYGDTVELPGSSDFNMAKRASEAEMERIGLSKTLVNDQSFSGRDDVYNKMQGLFHGGIAESIRKKITDFGSGFDPLRKVALKLFKIGDENTAFGKLLKTGAIEDMFSKGRKVKRLGKGEFGEANLYEGMFRGEKQQWVVKESFKGKEHFLEQEFNALKEISGEMMPSAYKMSDDGSKLYMEYMPGETLEDLISGGKVDREFVENVVAGKVEEQAGVIASKGFENLDINAGNIMYDPKTNRTSWIDFGLARRGSSEYSQDNMTGAFLHKANKSLKKAENSVQKIKMDNQAIARKIKMGKAQKQATMSVNINGAKGGTGHSGFHSIPND